MDSISNLLTLTSHVIFTCQQGMEQIVLNEIAKISPGAKCAKRIDTGIVLVSLPGSFMDFFQNITPASFIFVRHLQPVVATLALSAEGILEKISEEVDSLSDVFNQNIPISIQIGMLKNCSISISAFEMNEIIEKIYTTKGFQIDVAAPQQILSLTVSTDNVYIGISTENYSLSGWRNGNIRFSKDDSMISRAEFKLLEAYEVFHLPIKSGGFALDLGAAPGGWTKALVEKNYSVVAVDPGELSEKLHPHPQVTYKKMTAETFFQENEKMFDLITNDMKMDMDASIDIMLLGKPFLHPDGIGLMTFKLPATKQQAKAHRGIGILQKHFEIIGARQLFHNRSEITVAFKKFR